MRKLQKLLAVSAMLCVSNAMATPFEVTITSNAPNGGVFFTPVWVGFHDGSFDTYNLGDPTSAALESLAELGMTGPISMEFAASAAGMAGGVDDTIAGPLGPFMPGDSASQTFDLAGSPSNTFFSYASMVLPSSDYFIANDDPMEIDLSALFSGMATEITFNIGLAGAIVDAGTELNDFATSPASDAFFGTLTDPVASVDDMMDLSTLVTDPFADFLNQPAAGALDQLDFNDTTLYPNGLATITIRALPTPEPGSLALVALGSVMLVGARRKRTSK